MSPSYLLVIWSVSLARKPTTLMQPANTARHVVVPYMNLAREGWLEICLSSHSIRFWPMRTSISGPVQLGPRTLCGSAACDWDEICADCPTLDLPPPRPPLCPAVGVIGPGSSPSKNSSGKSICAHAGTWVEGYSQVSPKSTMSSIFLQTMLCTKIGIQTCWIPCTRKATTMHTTIECTIKKIGLSQRNTGCQAFRTDRMRLVYRNGSEHRHTWCFLPGRCERHTGMCKFWMPRKKNPTRRPNPGCA